jgi:7-cyano-7-deazaguanine synthase
MLYDLVAKGHRVHCVLFNYRQKHVQELEFAKLHCRRLGVTFTIIDITQLRGSTLTDGTGSMIVPMRNATMISHACNLAVSAGADTVTFAANKDDEAEFPDCRMAFVQAFNTLNAVQEILVEICAPYHDKRKWEILDIGRQHAVDFNETWSCYNGGVKQCGTCPACQKRIAALNHTANKL